MEIRKLEAFCKVVELKSFTLAAREMLLSQPTISEHIRYLEEELGQQLLERTQKEITPTEAGQTLYKYARKILRTKDEAVLAVSEHGKRLTGNVVIGCSTIPGTYLLPPLLGQFHEQYDAVKTTLRINSSRIIADQVLGGQLEFGLVGAKWNEAGLKWTPFVYDELVVVIPYRHSWAGREEVALTELFQEPFVQRERESGTRKVVAQLLAENNFREENLQSVSEIGSTAAVKEVVKSGAGIGILSRQAVVDEVRCGTLATVSIQDHQIVRPFYIVQRKSRKFTRATAAFHTFLLTSLKKNGLDGKGVQ